MSDLEGLYFFGLDWIERDEESLALGGVVVMVRKKIRELQSVFVVWTAWSVCE